MNRSATLMTMSNGLGLLLEAVLVRGGQSVEDRDDARADVVGENVRRVARRPRGVAEVDLDDPRQQRRWCRMPMSWRKRSASMMPAPVNCERA